MSDAGFLIGTLLIFSLVIYVIFSSKKIKALGISIAVMILYVGYVKFSCGADSSVVRTATPMVEKIADYIVENGLPESLSSIPNLPYMIEKCEKETIYNEDRNYAYIVTKEKKNSDLTAVFENCRFSDKNKLYKIQLWFEKYYDDNNKFNGSLEVTSNGTWVGSSFKSLDGKKIIFKATKFYSHRRTGICQSFRQ